MRPPRRKCTQNTHGGYSEDTEIRNTGSQITAGTCASTGRVKLRFVTNGLYDPLSRSAQSAAAIAWLLRRTLHSRHGRDNGPGDTYGWHEHGYEKARYCVRGRIVFHTASGDIRFGPGDKMVLPPHTVHAATIGAEGMRCIEAPRERNLEPRLTDPARGRRADDLSWSGRPSSRHERKFQ